MVAKAKGSFLATDQFTRKQVLEMLIPLVLDQLFVYCVGLLTTAMISSSGQDSVAAVSLANPISHMSLLLFSAFASGGCVVIAQYKGKGDEEKAREAMGQTVFLVMSMAILLSGILILFAGPIIRLLYATAEEAVIDKAILYLVGMAVNNVVHALRCCGSAAFRAVGEIKKNTIGTFILNFSFFVFSFICVNLLKLDIYGTLLAYFMARILGSGYTALYLFVFKKSPIYIPLKSVFRPKKVFLKPIWKLGLPFSWEEVFFQGGTILVSSIIVLLGTGAVAANAIVSSVFNMLYAPVTAVGLLATTVVSQCVGAGRRDLAKKYGKDLCILAYLVCGATLLLVLPLIKPIVGIYHPEAEVLPVVYQLIIMGMAGMLMFYPLSCVMPYTLKAAGDAYYSTAISLVGMWVVRVVFGYLAAIWMGWGMQGIWMMMILEWLTRGLLFLLRYRGKKWLTKKTINA